MACYSPSKTFSVMTGKEPAIKGGETRGRGLFGGERGEGCGESANNSSCLRFPTWDENNKLPTKNADPGIELLFGKRSRWPSLPGRSSRNYLVIISWLKSIKRLTYSSLVK